jgi:hypothetical protein
MNQQKRLIFVFYLVALVSMLLLTACMKSEDTSVEDPTLNFSEPIAAGDDESVVAVSNVLDNLTIEIPAGAERQRVSSSQEIIQRDNITVGGIFLFECDEAIFNDVLNYSDSLTPLVIQAMEKVITTDITWHMGETSRYGLMEYNFGNEESEYIAYLIRGYTACYILWFDRQQISYDMEIEMMQSVQSADIVDELNKISSEQHMEAIAGKIDNGEYTFAVNLPDVITQEQASDGSLFYMAGQLIGGYKVVHFEKGILPAVNDNEELILARLKEYLMDQIDLSNYSGKITDQALITAVFTSDNVEYTLFILSYGQIGTQYVIWLDTATLEQDTVDSIMWGAQLVKK